MSVQPGTRPAGAGTPADPQAPGGPEDERVAEKVERLNSASLRRVVEPDEEVTGRFGPGCLLPRHLLSVADLDLDLTPDQLARLSREEVASIATEGIRFEAVLMAGFGLLLASSPDVTDPRVAYMLHEVGEETRHSRLFARMVRQLDPQAPHPLERPLLNALVQIGVGRIIRRPALLFTMVLGGEEIPDLLQKLAVDDPGTDPFLRAVNRYHRQEEARHLAYARLVLPEVWAAASRLDRLLVRHLAPRIIGGMFDTLVNPGVYATVGLPVWSTWRAVRTSPSRVALRRRATRPILEQLQRVGAFGPAGVPRPWRRLCGVDRRGRAQD